MRTGEGGGLWGLMKRSWDRLKVGGEKCEGWGRQKQRLGLKGGVWGGLMGK